MVKYAATLALLSVAVLCVSLTLALVRVEKHVNQTMMKLDSNLDEMHRLTLEAGLTAMEARKASRKESAYLDQWNTQISQVMGDMHSVAVTAQTTIASVQPVMQSTQATVEALQAPIAESNRTLTTLNDTVRLLQPVISDPAIPATIANVQATTAHLDATSKDVQDEVHKFTHPGIWARIKGALLDVAHVFNPL